MPVAPWLQIAASRKQEGAAALCIRQVCGKTDFASGRFYSPLIVGVAALRAENEYGWVHICISPF